MPVAIVDGGHQTAKFRGWHLPHQGRLLSLAILSRADVRTAGGVVPLTEIDQRPAERPGSIYPLPLGRRPRLAAPRHAL